MSLLEPMAPLIIIIEQTTEQYNHANEQLLETTILLHADIDMGLSTAVFQKWLWGYSLQWPKNYIIYST